MLAGGIFIGLMVGIFAGNWWASRWIDHRWYCGHRHRASHPCRATPENRRRWEIMEEQSNRAEELEEEAKRLRRYGS